MPDDLYRLSNYDYTFPKELIAQQPLVDRSASKLMILDRLAGSVTHSRFSSITDYFEPGDCLVINDTKVIPANIEGKTEKKGSAVSVLILDNLGGNIWDVLMKNSRRVNEGDYCIFAGGIRLKVIKKKGRLVEAEFNFNTVELIKQLWKFGSMPLPPYIKDDVKNTKHRERYQTVYAENQGAVAAPTAGLHFTPEIFSALKAKGVITAPVTLHVGLGTFESISEEDIRLHHMHSEHYDVSPGSALAINTVKKSGKKIIAVGTTSMRVLEAAANVDGGISAGSGSTSIYIYPGYTFRIVDRLITNFHLPKTSLLALVSAFAGLENIRKAYAEAIAEKYRLFSYGDSMFIL
jgi:S-adenosylmethionine:tRNA ribosyltransferase-isomerase